MKLNQIRFNAKKYFPMFFVLDVILYSAIAFTAYKFYIA